MARRTGKTHAMKLAQLMALGKAADERIRGTQITSVIFDELHYSAPKKGKKQMATKKEPLSDEAIRRLTELTTAMTDYFQLNEVKTDLLSPATLTAQVPGKGFRKVSHVGGETFIFGGVYLGKTNRPIFKLTPEADSASVGYSHVELTEQEAQSLLDNFRSHCTAAAGRNYREAMHEITGIERQAAQVEEVKQKATDYEQYGSW